MERDEGCASAMNAEGSTHASTMNAVPRLLLLLLPLAAALPVHGFPKKHPVTDRMRRGGWAPAAGEARATPTTPPAAAASDSIEEGEEQGGEEAGEGEPGAARAQRAKELGDRAQVLPRPLGGRQQLRE